MSSDERSEKILDQQKNDSLKEENKVIDLLHRMNTADQKIAHNFFKSKFDSDHKLKNPHLKSQRLKSGQLYN